MLKWSQGYWKTYGIVVTTVKRDPYNEADREVISTFGTSYEVTPVQVFLACINKLFCPHYMPTYS